MQKLLTIEVEEDAIERISEEASVGILIILKCGTHILVYNDKIGIFSADTINSPDIDFSNIETLSMGLYLKDSFEIEDFPDVSNPIQ